MKLRIVWSTLLIAVLCIFQSTSAQQLPDPVGRVVWVKGMLIATMANDEQRILKKKSIVYLGDRLTTDDRSMAEIVFTDNTLMTLRKNTDYTIKAYAYNPKGKGKDAGKSVSEVVKGGFRTVTGLIAEKNPDGYAVETPVATIGVRGTDYEVALKDGELYVGFFKGKPCVENKPTSDNPEKKKTKICLSKSKKYAKVKADGSAPVPLDQKPTVFNEVLEIIPATISPFKYGIKDGTISSFCIQ